MGISPFISQWNRHESLDISTTYTVVVSGGLYSRYTKALELKLTYL
jgi:hypothetical protein